MSSFGIGSVILNSSRSVADIRTALAAITEGTTATATEDTLIEIQHALRLDDPEVVCTGFDRPNIHLSVRSCRDDHEKKLGVSAITGQWWHCSADRQKQVAFDRAAS